jgi:Rad3-related DNA helicase
MEHSRYASLMVGNTADPESDTALEVARGFREIAAPVILVSPSFAMGWDFPKSECEYIIICKVPFLNNGTKIQREREANDPTYSAYMAMQQLVQSAGRGMRSEDDRCEAIIVDGHLSWFLYRNKSLAPAWFVNAVRKVWEIPNPPEKLR